MKAGGGKPAFSGAAWNGCTADLIRTAKAHAYLVLQHTFYAHVQGLQKKVCVSSVVLASRLNE